MMTGSRAVGAALVLCLCVSTGGCASAPARGGTAANHGPGPAGQEHGAAAVPPAGERPATRQGPEAATSPQAGDDERPSNNDTVITVVVLTVLGAALIAGILVIAAEVDRSLERIGGE